MSKYVREIDSIDGLRNTPTSDAAAAHVRTPTGQSGIFVPMDTDPFGNGDDGAVAVQASDGTWWTRRKRLSGSVVRAGWYGAIPDGNTDNAAAINAAISNAPPAGRVILPAGIIGIGSEIDYSNRVDLTSENSEQETVIKALSDFSGQNLLSTTNLSIPKLPRISDLKFDGNGENPSRGVFIDSGNYRLVNVFVKACEIGIEFRQTEGEGYARYIRATNCTTGFLLDDAKDNTIIKPATFGCERGMQLKNNNGQPGGNQIIGPVIQNSNKEGILVGDADRNVFFGGRLEGNNQDDAGLPQLHLKGAGKSNKATANKVLNMFIGGSGATNASAGILLGDETQNIIKGNSYASGLTNPVNIDEAKTHGNTRLFPTAQDDVSSYGFSPNSDFYFKNVKINSGDAFRSEIQAGDFYLNSKVKRLYTTRDDGSNLSAFEPMNKSTINVSSNITLEEQEGYIRINASNNPVTISLPSSPTLTGLSYLFIAVDATNQILLDGNGNDIGVTGGSSVSLNTADEFLKIVYDGNVWLPSGQGTI